MAKTPKNTSGKPMWGRDQRNSWHGVEFPYYGRSGQTIGGMSRHDCEMILSVDDSVGRIVRTLRDNDLDRNTLIGSSSSKMTRGYHTLPFRQGVCRRHRKPL